MNATSKPSRRLAPSSAARRRVVVIGPMAPAVGGMTTVIEQLLAGPLSRSYEFIRQSANAGDGARRSWWHSCKRHLGQLYNLARRLGSGGADLVHIHTCSGFTFYRNLIDLVVARLFGVPVVLHIHGAQFDEFCARSGRLGRGLIRHGLAAADRVVVLSRDWRQRLQPFAPRAHFAIVPNG
ncbi:MAG: glycosyltransferase, partial [bacterium]|nr:glycosyltransferase [bacterium]